MRWFLLLTLAACAPEAPLDDPAADAADALPADALGPSGTGRLVISPKPAMLRGRTQRTPYDGGYRHMRAWLWASRAFGVSCPPEIAPDCLTIADPAPRISMDVANNSGSGNFTYALPADMPTGEYALQAGAKNGGARKQSRSAVVYILDANEDEDGDSLTNGREIDATHTDPLLADTDGGGEDDDAELARGANPLDPSDDR